MEFRSLLGEEYLHQQQQHEQYDPPEVCWCRGASNMMEVKWVQELMVLLKSVVREEVEEVAKRVILPHLPSVPLSSPPVISSSSLHQAESSVSRRLGLHFNGYLPDTLLTMNKIQYEGASLQVELLDEFGCRVEVGPESSTKIKIVVLDGDFETEDNNWTEEEFNKNLSRPRKDKTPLLKGKCEITLSRGVASISDISFTDNSKSMRNGTFRLGAQIMKPLPGVVVREAVNKAFKVKERRLQSNRKHEKPYPEDDLWRLVNIRKDGPVYQRAVEARIYKVKDFLQLYHTDAKAMRDILHVPETKWNEIVENAEACVITSENYKYFDDITGVELLLDCTFNIVAVTYMGQSTQLYGSLDDCQKELVDNLRYAAYQKRNELKTHTTTNQIPVQADYCSHSYSKSPTNMQHLDDTEANQAHTGQVVLHSNSYSPGPLLEPFRLGGDQEQLELSVGQLQDSDADWLRDLLDSSTPTPQEGRLSEHSTKNNATSKLIAACYVTKAASMFMISIERNHGLQKKKRKLH